MIIIFATLDRRRIDDNHITKISEAPAHIRARVQALAWATGHGLAPPRRSLPSDPHAANEDQTNPFLSTLSEDSCG